MIEDFLIFVSIFAAAFILTILLQRPFVKSPMGVEETLQTLVGKELWIDNQRWGVIERCEKCGADLMYMLYNDQNTYYISLKLALSLAYKGVCKWVDMDAERCLCVMRVYELTEDKFDNERKCDYH